MIAALAARAQLCARPLSVLAAEAPRVRVGRAARDRIALVVLGVVDLLPVDRDAAVLVVAHAQRAEVALGPFLIAVVALLAPERLVLALVRGPVLELLRRVLLELFEVVLLVIGHGV